MKIAIPTNDRKTIAAHTGKCREFAFFEIENGKLISIVEIKGYWKDKVWKFNELKNMFNENNININLSIITNINPYLIDSSCGKEIKNWKKNRKLIC